MSPFFSALHILLCVSSINLANDYTLIAHEKSVFNGEIMVIQQDSVRQLYTRNGLNQVLQSSMNTQQPERLLDTYTQIMSTISALITSPELAFNIGLGGGILPRFQLYMHPNSRVISVDIDPMVISIARQYFMVEHTNHMILTGDGAKVLAAQKIPFDLIWVDAYSPESGIPEVFKSTSFINQLPNKLTQRGIIMANLWHHSATGFSQLIDRYQKPFKYGLVIPIPGAKNKIVAVSNNDQLTCKNVLSKFREWLKNKTISYAESGQAESTRISCYEPLNQVG